MLDAPAVALDVALLLPGDAEARVRELNARLRRDHPLGFAFDDSHLPHLTLVQQATSGARLGEVVARVGEVARGCGALDLEARGVGRGGSTSHLVVAPHPRLQRLHGELVAALAPLGDAPVTEAAFDRTGGEEPRPQDLAWVRSFRAEASGDRFWPHVTLGAGELREAVEPFAFVLRRLALCRLGRYCTCRQVLAEWDLGERGRRVG